MTHSHLHGSDRSEKALQSLTSTHSHFRGMNFEKIVPNVTLPDAFPHTRDSRGVYPVDRFTPTSVGQTKRYESQASSVSIHSHSRGIKWRPPCFPGTRHESFPRMWDKPRNALEVFSIFRHSHSRGTSAIRNRQFHDDRDSFPRMWDK